MVGTLKPDILLDSYKKSGLFSWRQNVCYYKHL
jgi:hypothetical protein